MRALGIIALLSVVLIAAAQAQVWIMSPSGGGRVQGASAAPSSNCIEYQSGGCLLYASGSSNAILVQ